MAIETIGQADMTEFDPLSPELSNPDHYMKDISEALSYARYAFCDELTAGNNFDPIAFEEAVIGMVHAFEAEAFGGIHGTHADFESASETIQAELAVIGGLLTSTFDNASNNSIVMLPNVRRNTNTVLSYLREEQTPEAMELGINPLVGAASCALIEALCAIEVVD